MHVDDMKAVGVLSGGSVRAIGYGESRSPASRKVPQGMIFVPTGHLSPDGRYTDGTGMPRQRAGVEVEPIDPEDTKERSATAIIHLRQSRAAYSVPAWEQIETGRYMPRRIRGSFPGRELG
jgi:formylmethanofuran dehydrogenase subunit D